MAKYSRWLTPEGLELLKGWARAGLTMDQIAANAGVSRTQFYSWQKKYPEIKEALKKGKEVVDFEVENALVKSALGYDWLERTWVRDEDTGKMVEVKQQTKHCPPNATSLIFFLKNRMPQAYRDKVREQGQTPEQQLSNLMDTIKEAIEAPPPEPAEPTPPTT